MRAEFNHPIKIAERTAVLDILSGGRLDVGTGRSATWTELAGFRASPDEPRRPGTNSSIACRNVDAGALSYQGARGRCTQRTIVPKPYQKPHPPRGSPSPVPALRSTRPSADGQSRADLRRIRRAGREGQALSQDHPQCTPVGDVVNEAVSTVNFLYCHEDDAEGVKVGKRLTGTFNYLAAQLLRRARGVSEQIVSVAGTTAVASSGCAGPGDASGAPEGIAIGNPARITREMKKWEAVGCDRVNFLLNALETVLSKRCSTVCACSRKK